MTLRALALPLASLLREHRRLEHFLELLKIGVVQFFSQPVVFLLGIWVDSHPHTLAQKGQYGYLPHVPMRSAKA